MQLKLISTITHEEHTLHLESPFQAYMQLDVLPGTGPRDNLAWDEGKLRSLVSNLRFLIL